MDRHRKHVTCEQIGRGVSQRGSNDRHLPVIKMPLLAALRKYHAVSRNVAEHVKNTST